MVSESGTFQNLKADLSASVARFDATLCQRPSLPERTFEDFGLSHNGSRRRLNTVVSMAAPRHRLHSLIAQMEACWGRPRSNLDLRRHMVLRQAARPCHRCHACGRCKRMASRWPRQHRGCMRWKGSCHGSLQPITSGFYTAGQGERGRLSQIRHWPMARYFNRRIRTLKLAFNWLFFQEVLEQVLDTPCQERAVLPYPGRGKEALDPTSGRRHSAQEAAEGWERATAVAEDPHVSQVRFPELEACVVQELSGRHRHSERLQKKDSAERHGINGILTGPASDAFHGFSRS